jgi:uncharacterized protein YecE (DUF72 family)
MKVFVGTSGYSYTAWKGKFYPEKTSPKKMLHSYSQRFAAVEINNTFYRMPTESVVASWAAQVPDDFVFAVKAPRVITHLKRLRYVEADTDYLFRTLSVLGKKLGPVLFQFPKTFHADLPTLEAFLALIPAGAPCAFEFRSPSWRNDETLKLLRGRGCSLCIADSDENPADGIVRTASWGYLRLRRSDYEEADLSRWMKSILDETWRRAYVFFKHEEEAAGPDVALQFRQMIDLGMERRRRRKRTSP